MAPFDDADVYHDLDGYMLRLPGMANGCSGKDATSATAMKFFERVVDRICSQSFPTLMCAIYGKYRNFNANSVFAG